MHTSGEPEARALVDCLQKGIAKYLGVEEKPYTTRPAAPFTTSTLQQDASRKLGFAARRTMQVAQTLYENGFITYMRTDSTTLSDEALNAARTLIARDFGPQFLYPEPRIYKTKVKNAQEAHEGSVLLALNSPLRQPFANGSGLKRFGSMKLFGRGP